MEPLDWTPLYRMLRPGSRTVLYRPTSQGEVVELARRGFRLLIVHESREFVDSSRALLRESGLTSQLMGAQILPSGRELALASHFYDLFVYCSIVDETLKFVAQCLGPQGRVVLRGLETPSPEGFEDLHRLESFRLLRPVS